MSTWATQPTGDSNRSSGGSGRCPATAATPASSESELSASILWMLNPFFQSSNTR
uniref:Uncharacterized protein n=1 Tax=Arundo donax TaxID=35708 RepID=A0A0A8YMZ2_ARUDO